MKSECRGCSAIFTSLSAFDKHRTGSFGEPTTEGKYKHERRCMTEEEMLIRGLVKNEKGWWTSGGTFDRSVFGKKEEPEEMAEEEQEQEEVEV